MPKLIDFWGEFDPSHDQSEFLHPLDRPVIASHERAMGAAIRRGVTLQEAISSDDFLDPSSSTLQTSLLPQPYLGNLQAACVFILLLNPGYNEADHYAEHDPQWREACRRTLRQDFPDDSTPFHALDPAFCWAGAFRWWERLLRPIARRVASEKCQGSYGQALRLIGARIAALELFPYRSTTFGHEPLISGKSELPSVSVMKQYVREELLPRACRGEIVLVAARASRKWALGTVETGQFFPLGSSNARFLHFGSETAHGEAILTRMLA